MQKICSHSERSNLINQEWHVVVYYVQQDRMCNRKLQFRALCKIPRTDGLIEVLEWPFMQDFRGHNLFPLSEHSNTVYERLSVCISIYFRHFHWIVHLPNPTYIFCSEIVSFKKTTFSSSYVIEYF